MRYYGLPPARVHVYPFGVDQELFHPRRAPEGRALVRQRTGDDRPYLIFTAAISPRKNLKAVREALLRLADRGLPHALVIVGADPPGDFDREALRQEAFAELPGHPGRILPFLDPSDEELARLVAGATAACQPSRFEGFGLPALEAMASGVPVVVSDRAALPEVVGKTRSVVEPTADGVERALLEIIYDPFEPGAWGPEPGGEPRPLPGRGRRTAGCVFSVSPQAKEGDSVWSLRAPADAPHAYGPGGSCTRAAALRYARGASRSAYPSVAPTPC